MDSELNNKHLIILGLARQGKALARFAAAAGAFVTVTDLRSAETLQTTLAELSDLNIEFILGEHPMTLLDKADMIAISGGVPTQVPLVQAARERNIPVTNDSQEFIKRVPTAVIGITGSSGKTTTTALTGIMGQISGRTTWIGGNIGRPLIADLHKMNPGDMVVQELSSFQLEIWNHSPHVAAVLNITPNHLDRHKTMGAYTDAKANILRHQNENDIAVLAADDPGALALEHEVCGRLRTFSLRGVVEDGAFVRNSEIWVRNGDEKRVCPLDDIQLRGQHNVLNVLAAVTLADSVGVPVDAMAQAIRTFKGVEHRLELVREHRGIRYINDSIATAPERAIAALSAFDEPLILLAGGQDKDMAWDAWTKQVSQRAKHVILFGKLADMLQQRLHTAGYDAIIHEQTLAEAVTAAAQIAEAGDIVLLSPGGTSFDAFVDFAERGKQFRELVNRL
ncbi:MAG: UDP-N-acetylmuramoyl-L-alanine--D-glutamate ligase [Chloroflexi bacterium]|nr:MAG: UDP-N-acetylmuramoyl-L-alanine--D-glutamate ligase [Chloroflexota bacterium]PIE80259.1 MAG: UDP-N-acetylmuramoyl-L-alanine--D-glutamate ligase [Chloroflexota bacterium]